VTTPRTTRLVRADDLPALHRGLYSLARRGSLGDIRRRVILVPSRAAAHLLRQTLEDLRFRDTHASQDAVLVLPDLLTRDDWYQRMHERAGLEAPRLTELEREVILGRAAREAVDSGAAPPFRLRPGLIAEMLAFYDALCRQQRTIDTFDRIVMEDLEPRAELDRGAARLLGQTRFLVAAFRGFETRVAASGALDEPALRRRLLDAGSRAGFTHVVVAVGDRTAEPSGGLAPADFDLMMRLPNVEAIDIVATSRQLGSGLHERLHDLIPGLEETEAKALPASTRLVAPAGDNGPVHFTSRDREEELRAIARRIKATERRVEPPRALGNVAVVFRRPLPYVYLATTVFDAAGIEYQAADSLPLAAEPVSAVFDLVCAAVESRFARTALLALMRSPHLEADPGHERLPPEDVEAFDRGLGEARYFGGPQALARLAEQWVGSGARAARAAAALTLALQPLAEADRVSAHAAGLLDFLGSHERMDFGDDTVRSRHLRARGAVMSVLDELRHAALAFDDPRARFTDVAATVRRWIESQTFSSRRGTGGVHLADAQAARFGAFDVVHLAGLADGDWPERAAHNIFYPTFLLSKLGWPSEVQKQSAAKAAFLDLLTLARHQVSVSTFTLEDDSIVSPSPLIEEIPRAGLEVDRVDPPDALVFADEALAASLPAQAAASGDTAAWLALRRERSPAWRAEFHGHAGAVRRPAHTVTEIDRFLQCPFKYFARTVLELPEEAGDEPSMTPRAEGEFIHGVFRAFFDSWQAAGHGAITADLLPEARAHFGRAAARLLDTLPASEAALQRMRLLGSVGTPGLGETVLAAEAERPIPVRERLLEYEIDGEFTIAAAGTSRTVRLRGKADRIDLLEDGRLRLVDYKTGRAPDLAQTIQLPIYAVCARQQLRRTRGEDREVAEAGYMALGERKPVRVIVDDGPEAAGVLAEGQQRLLDVIGQIERGEFPPRPASTRLCGYCEYATVCRKDYVDGE
jgi:ATP-dependent helicase/nuclease subunit B